jgi:hypothetical protein
MQKIHVASSGSQGSVTIVQLLQLLPHNITQTSPTSGAGYTYYLICILDFSLSLSLRFLQNRRGNQRSSERSSSGMLTGSDHLSTTSYDLNHLISVALSTIVFLLKMYEHLLSLMYRYSDYWTVVLPHGRFNSLRQHWLNFLSVTLSKSRKTRLNCAIQSSIFWDACKS